MNDQSEQALAELASLVAKDKPGNRKLRHPTGGAADPGSLISLLTESTDRIHDYALQQMQQAKRQIEEAAAEALSKIEDVIAVIGARRAATHAQFREYVESVTSACDATDGILLAVRSCANEVIVGANGTGAAVMSMEVAAPATNDEIKPKELLGQ